MLNEILKRLYLDRINFTGDIKPTFECFKELHLAHLQHIPFENLDIPLNRRIHLNSESVLNKLLEQKRGGFCYELNYAFSLLLASVGFEVNLLSARVFDGEELGKEFDHLLISVKIENALFIADVGFGDSFREPLNLNSDVSCQLNANYKIQRNGAIYTLAQQKNNEPWLSQYVFTLDHYDISDFEHMCQFHQSSPQSGFTKKSVCTLATSDGRITISNGRLIISSSGGKNQTRINCRQEYEAHLLEYFKIILPKDAPVNRLLHCAQ